MTQQNDGTTTREVCQRRLFALEQRQLRSPYDLYRQWREIGPVIYLEDQDIYVVTRHDMIKSVSYTHLTLPTMMSV